MVKRASACGGVVLGICIQAVEAFDGGFIRGGSRSGNISMVNAESWIVHIAASRCCVWLGAGRIYSGDSSFKGGFTVYSFGERGSVRQYQYRSGFIHSCRAEYDLVASLVDAVLCSFVGLWVAGSVGSG